MSTRLKLDENFSPSVVAIFQLAGFDAHSVFSEQLSGASDETIFEVILKEERILLTFDTDFCNILRFPPDKTEGIIVIRPSSPLSLSLINAFAIQVRDLLQIRSPKGCLWVLEPGKLRIRYNDL